MAAMANSCQCQGQCLRNGEAPGQLMGKLGNTWRFRENTLENWEFYGILGYHRKPDGCCFMLPVAPAKKWMVHHHNKRSSYGKSPLSMRISSITNINIIKDLQISDVPVWVYCHVWVPEGPGCGMAGTPPSSLSRMVHFRDTHPFLKMVGMAGNHTFQSAGGSCTGKKKTRIYSTSLVPLHLKKCCLKIEMISPWTQSTMNPAEIDFS